DQKIPTLDAFLTNNPADAAVVFSDTLIARSGSVLFKQEHTQYPSVKHLAKDIIVISRINNIVRDLKEALRFQNEINNNLATPLMEIITPSLPEQTEDDTVYTAINKRFILFLIC
ncbi:MAG: LUD domain-containing protein, partial [Bacteroidales bacterium]|nr:LUD domain-containing protein [Bacteroidales bacterium]